MIHAAERYSIELRARAPDVLVGAGAALLSLTIGWKIGHDSSRLPMGFALIVLLALVAVRAFGVAVGLLVLTALNGLPFVDLEHFSQSGSVRPSDVAIMGLGALLALRSRASVSNPQLQWWVVASRWWCLSLISWWLLTVLRSNFFSGIPLTKAALFGRDFAFFAFLVPLLIVGLRTRRETIEVLGTLLAAAVAFALGHLALVVLNVHQGTWLVHQSLSNDIGGVTRVYALMGDVVVAALPIGIALALMGGSRRFRLWGGGVAVLCGVSVLLQFARATYFGLFLGLICASGVWLAHNAGGAIARRLVIVLAGLALVAGFVLTSASGTTSPSPTLSASTVAGQPPSEGGLPAPVIFARFSSGVNELSSKTGTVGYRYDLDRKMFHVLGRHWLIGLGFWHPAARYVPELPAGSIRNTDTGVMNSLMTMGVVGTVLVLLAPISVLIAVFRRRRAIRPRDQWFFFGVFTWIVALLVGSISLVTLFSVSGLALTSTVLACTVRLLAEPEYA